MRCIEQLEEKSWSISTTGHLKEVWPAGFDCNKFYYIFSFQHDCVAQFGSEQDWSTSLKDSHNHKVSYNREKNPKLGHSHRCI